jgi:hypothetical protein
MAKSFDSQIRAYQKGGMESMRKDPTFPIYKLGYDTGLQEIRTLVLTYLEEKYVHAEDKPERNTPEAKYLLGLATELANLLRSAGI